jgi:hypothetical protein
VRLAGPTDVVQVLEVEGVDKSETAWRELLNQATTNL